MRVEFMQKILNISHSQIDNYILVICTFSLFDRQFVKLKAFFFYACFKYMFFKILEISKLAIIDLYQLNSQLLTAFLQPQYEALRKCLHLLENLEWREKDGSYTSRKKPFQLGLICSIKAALYTSLEMRKEGVDYLLTKRYLFSICWLSMTQHE